MKEYFKTLQFLALFYLLYTIASVKAHAVGLPCAARVITNRPFKMVCVCNETYCDTVEPIKVPEKGTFAQYSSSMSGKRLQRTHHSYTDQKRNRGYLAKGEYKIKLVVNRTQRFQTILGFGAAFTDAAGINVASLPENLQQTLLNSYFGQNGIGYTIGRIPIGGCDFSPREYTYDDSRTIDLNLSSFSLQDEDYKYKLPYLQLAKNLTSAADELLLYASPWSAPPWMKSNNDFKGRGILKQEYYQVWADYIVKFLKSYEKHGIKMWGLTTQNEPIDGLIPFFPFNAMGWTASMQRDWIKHNLGPTLHRNGFEKLKLIIFDDNTMLLHRWTKTILSDTEASKFVSGIGVHWYTRSFFGYNGLGEVDKLYPDKFMLGTEACTGFLPWERKVDLGSWERGEMYAEDIVQQLLQGVVGWTDWNFALDLEGGPNWANMGADAPIIVDKERQEFYKQPMFYVMAHFSKFFPKGSQIISGNVRQPSSISRSRSTSTLLDQLVQDNNANIFTELFRNEESETTTIHSNIFALTAQRSDGAVVTTLLNKNDIPITVDLFDWVLEGHRIIFTVEPRSITTVLYS